MIRAVADTHAIVWYIYDDPRLSLRARSVIEAAAQAGDTIGIATITLVEIIYLSERSRIATDVLPRLSIVFDEADSVLEVLPLTRQIAMMLENISRDQIPDMPDRIIAATALAVGVPLLTRDGRINRSGIATIW